MITVVLVISTSLLLFFLYPSKGMGTKWKLPASISIFIPWYDQALSFGLNPTGFLQQQRKLLGPVHQIRLAGQRVVVAHDLPGIHRVLNDFPKTLHLINHQLLRSMGGVKQPIPDPILDKFTFHVARTFSSKSIPNFSPIFCDHLLRRLQFLADGPPSDRIPLHEFVDTSLHDALSSAVWGPLYPRDCFNDFRVLEANITRLLGPQIFIPRPVIRAREKLKTKIGTYMRRLMEGDKAGTPSGLAETLGVLWNPIVPPENAAGAIASFFFAFYTSTHRAVSWVLLHLLSDRGALLRVRKEIDHAIDVEFGTLQALLALEPQKLAVSLPLLESAAMETMRVRQTAITVRNVLEDTVIYSDGEENSLTAYPGEMVMANSYGINMSNDIFANAQAFKIDRFVNTSARKSMSDKFRTSPLGIFGGGARACKGRDLALYEIKIFVVLALRLLDIEIQTKSGSSIEGREIKANPALSIPSSVMVPSEQFFVHVRHRVQV